jgi:pimeloyl-ACP methyl ester carboxylesterase
MNHPPPADFPNFPPEEPPQFFAGQLAWNEYGDPSGTPVFYYHGWPSSRLQARLAHRLAADRGIRLLSMDRPGMGRSAFQAGRTLESWPELMERFADSLGIGKFGQLAVSGGGPYALACAARIPERLAGTAVLAGAVPLDESAVGLEKLHFAYRALMPFRNWPGGLFSPMFRAAAWAARLSPRTPPMSWALATLAAEDGRVMEDFPDIWPIITRSFRESADSGNGRGIMADAAIYFQPLSFALADIRSPIRYWHGGDDRNIPLEMVTPFIEQIPSATLEVEPAMGHFSLVIREAPAALDFLAGCARKRGD